MSKSRLTFALLALAFFGGRAEAQAPGRAWLVPFDELERRLPDPDLRLLDARPKADYDRGHIPGAVWVDVKAVEALAAKPGALADRATWEAWIAPLGIGPKSEVVVYDASRQLAAARIWWLLGYLGVERVGLLNGNFRLWAEGGHPVTAEVKPVAPQPFPVAFRKDRHATQEEVLAALGSKTGAILDARSDEEYVGSKKLSKRAGHIPTACHLEWSQLVDPDGRFLDDATLRAKLAKAGVDPGVPVITHCQGGGRASVNAFVLEHLGYHARNYYLGWSDWGNAEATPVQLDEPAGPKD
ncbi:sulfurtransferase [Tundrisphaera sp. TA3]|uniref:sulfurtransferase n=1 Tax=Tundrisphaera sp. TA3 TaxID=3435775 RepID=UPI003EBD3EAC